jgi:DNA-binding response OmpR family regulator
MRVLVIDDDPDVRMLCRINLRFDGHDVIEASGGAEGLALMASDPPDAILLDVMMPNLDGIQVLRRLRESEETVDVPVVIVSARVGIDDQIEGFEAGADDYLTKPFTLTDLSAVLDGTRRLDPHERRAQREWRLKRLVALVPR